MYSCSVSKPDGSIIGGELSTAYRSSFSSRSLLPKQAQWHISSQIAAMISGVSRNFPQLRCPRPESQVEGRIGREAWKLVARRCAESARRGCWLGLATSWRTLPSQGQVGTLICTLARCYCWSQSTQVLGSAHPHALSVYVTPGLGTALSRTAWMALVRTVAVEWL